jgi:hypothetical protein
MTSYSSAAFCSMLPYTELQDQCTDVCAIIHHRSALYATELLKK